MKTLDEVIKAMEICKEPDVNRTCKDCPMPDTQECMGILMTDALHYLRELKLFRQTPIMQGIHKAQKECALYPVDNWGEDEPESNPALSWDELRQMEGKPVWVENMFYKKWLIAYQINENDIIFDGNGFYTQAFVIDYGKSWQAYRKERG